MDAARTEKTSPESVHWLRNELIVARVSALGATISHLGLSESEAENLLASHISDRLPRMPPSGSRRDWQSAYKGGWVLLAPNADEPCVVAGCRHPAMGELSRRTWLFAQRERTEAILATTTNNGLSVRRRFEIFGSILRVTTTYRNISDNPAHLTHVEHPVVPWTDGDSVTAKWQTTCAGATQWCHDPLGQVTMDIASIAKEGTGRVLHLKIDDGWLRLSSSTERPDLLFTWAVKGLPFVWLWVENHSPEYPWMGGARLLGVEPATIPRPMSLSQAVSAQAHALIDPGEERVYCISVAVESRAHSSLSQWESANSLRGADSSTGHWDGVPAGEISTRAGGSPHGDVLRDQ